jgi:hypothetical protein
MAISDSVSWAHAEMSGARTWDGRCRSSLISICGTLVERLGLSLSSALGPALRQSAHRIVSNPKTTSDGLLVGHREQAAERGLGSSLILIAQDTTEFDYSSHGSTVGLGHLRSQNSRGLVSHAGLAMLPDGTPLGVVCLLMWARDPGEFGKSKTRNHRNTKDKESQKWIDCLNSAQDAFSPYQRLLFIQDRESDIFSFIAAPRRPLTHLLIRASRQRMVKADGFEQVKLFEAIDSAPVLGTFEVSVPRKPNQASRSATLEIRIKQVTALAPANQLPGEISEPQPIWVIKASETRSADEEAISWTLISTYPVEGLDDGIRMVQYYTHRWMIERLHYTLKSGCQAERLQVDDAQSLINVLALYYVVAWRVMYMAYQSRSRPDEPAEAMLTAVEIVVLTKMSNAEISTLQEAVKQVAKMGGYEPYKNGPPPGVKTIWLGLRKLQAMAEFYEKLQTANKPL